MGPVPQPPPGVTLDPVPVATLFPGRLLQVATFPALALAVGLGMVLAAPWVTRAVVAADRWLLVALLGPGQLAQRVADLEHTRALAVDDAAAQLRRVERDLHDGAQIRLATLAMHLAGQGEGPGAAADVARARELVDAAHRDAKQALGELRDLARGIHPPVLDSGLDNALATLAATSAVPVELACDLPERFDPAAIETIAYYCAAELLANAAKHSHAGQVTVQADGRRGSWSSGSATTASAAPTRPAAAAWPAWPSGSAPSTAGCGSPAPRRADPDQRPPAPADMTAGRPCVS